MEETGSSAAVIQTEQERWSEYPANHWKELQRFVEGNEYDPKQLFLLPEDIWDAWPYAQNGRPTEGVRYRFHFQHLRSFLKPYVKWYCYQRLIGSGKSLSQNAAALPYYLTSADDYLLAHDIACLEDLADPSVFAALWDSLVKPHDERLGPRPRKAVMHQLSTRTFWEYLRVHFGAPEIIPPHAPHMPRRPAEFAVDEQQIIPMPVIRQLINRLALHRDGKDPLNRYHHLRLCVLVLMLCLGRRVDEVLAAPRGGSPDGPLHSYPAKGVPIEDALWFQFSPNKQGPRDLVYISPEWRNVVHYCVRQLCTYSDEIRHLAQPREQSLLILISPRNWTAGCLAARTPTHQQKYDQPVQRKDEEADVPEIPTNGNQAKALSQARFRLWLNGIQAESTHERGILERWKITTDGSADGPIYYLHTHQTRHTRHSALSKDPQVSLLTRHEISITATVKCSLPINTRFMNRIKYS